MCTGLARKVRIMLAHARAIDMDARVRSGIGGAIDRKGREALLVSQVSQPAITAGLKVIGMDVADHAPLRMPARETMAKTLDELLVSGLTPHLERLEHAIARTEQAADRSTTEVLTGPRIGPVQDCWSDWGALTGEMEAAAMFFSWFAPEIAGCLWGCYFACEVMMYVMCWGG